MTWKHIAALVVAALLVLGCGVSHVCSEATTFQGVIQLATVIVGGTLGHAQGGGGRAKKIPRKPPGNSP